MRRKDSHLDGRTNAGTVLDLHVSKHSVVTHTLEIAKGVRKLNKHGTANTP